MQKLKWAVVGLLSLTSLAALVINLMTQSKQPNPAIALAGSTVAATSTCHYDPNSDQPNPLGMRAYVTITEEEGNTTFVYEQFPSPVAEKATLATRRELVFSATPLSQARTLLLKNKSLYSKLVGYDDPEGFQAVNSLLTCN